MADNVTTQELEDALNQLAESMGVSVKEYVQAQGYSTVEELTNAISNVQSQIDAIVTIDDSDGVETLAEKIKNLNAVLSNDAGELQNILDLIEQNSQAIQDAVGGDLTALTDRVTVVEDTLNDTTDEDGNLVKGIKSRVGDLETQAVANLNEAKAYADSVALKASSMDICAIGNSFRAALGLSNSDCSDGGDGDGAVV